MKNRRLAQWLQEHNEMLGSIEDEQDQSLHEALYEGIIDMAYAGHTEMIDPILETTAARSVAIGRPLTNLLTVPNELRKQIWERISIEIDPEPAFVMLADVDTIFTHIIRVMIDDYLTATQLAHAAKATEISRLYAEAEQKVLQYAAEVTRANRELSRLEQAKTDFISIAAHELKTPLTLIKGYINILRDMSLESQVANPVQGIHRGAERIGIILEDMLDLSAIDAQHLNLTIESVHLKSVMNLLVAQMAESLAERQQTIELNGLESLPLIKADVRRIHQIFKQLLSNAIKYTPDESIIKVIGRMAEATANRPAWVQIEIQDTGVGIAPEDRERIFEKFYRASDTKLHSTGATKFMGAGPGLGLAIARGLAEAHGGYIWVESQGFDIQNCPGSSFIVALPIKAEPPSGVHVKWL